MRPVKCFLMNSNVKTDHTSAGTCSGCDISTEEGVSHARENNLFREICPKMVESAALIAEKLICDD